jgi:iron complex outermembrane receptor protein
MKKLFLIAFPLATFAQQTEDSVKTILKDEVVVTATRATTNTPTTFSILKKKDMESVNLGQDLPIMLDFTPSVVTTSEAGAGVGYTGIRIRGTDATRINVTINGIPVNDGESQNVFWVNTPDLFSSVEDIQIQRGVGTSTNGSGAFGASVNVKTQRTAMKPYGEFSVSGGSFNTVKLTAKGGTGMIKDKFFIEGRLSSISSSGYIERASSNLWSYFVTAGFQHKSTMLKFITFSGREKTYQAWNGISEEDLKTNRRKNTAGTDYGAKELPWRNEIDNYQQQHYQLHFTQGFAQHFSFNAGLFTTIGKGYYEQYKVNQRLSKYLPAFDDSVAGNRADVIRRRWLDNIYYGSTFALNFDRRNIQATLGGLFSHYRNNHFGNIVWADGYASNKNKHYYDNKSLKNDFNVFAKVSYTLLQKITLYADVQYRYVKYSGKGFDNDKVEINFDRKWHFINPKGGINVAINHNHALYTSVAVANREPSREDVAYNKDVQHENMIDWEGGYKFNHRNFALQLNGYYMHYKNQLVLSGRLDDVGNTLRINVPSSFRAGIELAGAFVFFSKTSENPVFNINYNFTFSQNKIKQFSQTTFTYDDDYVPVDSLELNETFANTNISFSPDFIAGLELVATPVKGLRIALATKAISRQYLDNTSNKTRSLKPYSYSNLNAAYTFSLPKSRSITLSVLVNNLFNFKYENNGYTFTERYYSNGEVSPTVNYNYYYPQAGINFLAGVMVKL